VPHLSTLRLLALFLNAEPSAQVSGQKQLEVSGHLPPTDPACFPVWAGDGFARDALRADHPNLQKWCTTICVPRGLSGWYFTAKMSVFFPEG